MGKKGKILFGLFLLIFLTLSVFATAKPIFLTVFEKQKIVSPIPNFLNLIINRQVSGLNIWLPSLNDKNDSKLTNPEVTAESALLYDLTTKRVLYEKNPKKRLPMASLTKIATAIIALENKKQDDKYVVGAQDLVGEDEMGLTEGETMSLSDLLYGLILHSGNDAAETLASAYPSGRNGFIKAMNDKVKTLGLSDTNFTNPTGLEGDGRQYSTAYDLLVMTNYALSNFPTFNTVVSTFDYHIPYTNEHKEFYLENETNLLTSYPGVKGVKTGYTPEAGLCLITYLDYNGHKIIGVLLGSDNRIKDMKELLDYGLKSQGVNPPPHG